MTYPYPIPGSGSTPVQSPENWFTAGNQCCNGSVWKDAEATVRVFLDYTQAMANVIGGNSITSIVLTVTPVGDDTITIPSQSIINGVTKSFLVAGGVVNGQYNIEAVASLTDAQVWIDNITVYIKECGANVPAVGPTLLATLGPVIISNTLYYYATSGQTVFPLGTPDRFGHTGTLADHNVLVYDAGGRKVPYDNYTVSVGANTITFIHPLATGESAIFDIVNPPPPAPVIPPPILLTSGVIATTLYYVALAGQTVFSLGTPDEFGNIGSMTPHGVQVYRSGNRLVPIDNYTLDIINNSLTRTSPAGDSEPVIIELTTPPPVPVLVDIAFKSEALNITTVNVIPALSYPPNGVLTTLYINGLAFFSIGSQASFTISGNVLTWTSTMFSIPVGAAVVAVYTYG